MRSIITILIVTFVLVGLTSSMPNKMFKSPLEGDKFEGDIVFESSSSDKTLATNENLGVSYWPKGVVPYVLADSFISRAHLFLF